MARASGRCGSQDAYPQQDGMRGPFSGVDAVNVERIDSDEGSAFASEALGQLPGQERVPFEVGIGPPVAVPAGAEEHSSTSNLISGERKLLDRAASSTLARSDETVEVRERMKPERCEIIGVGVPVEGA